ncbi:sensor histidine kinase [Euzebyella marina]|uniref:histidine kinase n=1 Tax=Euzebyella marina TaxID=1761453 RepID=A0A3G2LA02_9FLAO|nr:HAMP domain-containing sensor histidine kinase [Euzebyella marina]AYN69079.1 sensor histidine kinase [Euzebyella marina]
MKLLNHTTKYFSILLIILISIWAVVFYFAMLDEVYDSLDDGLENQKELILQAVREDPSLLFDTEFGVNNYTIKKTSQPVSEHFYSDSYRDTLMYMQVEDEYEPVRILESIFEHKGDYYKIKLITSMVEEDDQIENLVKYLIVLYLLLISSILLLNNLIFRKIWKPFYDLIGHLKNFRIEKDEPIKTKPTSIDEFRLLNLSVEKLTEKSRKSYLVQKQFIENAAHELQTPLAISINKLELLVEKNELTDLQSQEVGQVLDSLGRLNRLNKSLLLLSKIDNDQYIEEERVSFNEVIHRTVENLEDFAVHRGVAIYVDEKEQIDFKINKDLSEILMLNLIKNAVIHSDKKSQVKIEVARNSITIKNIGENKALNPEMIFKRFSKNSSNKSSTGLGLAISKAITDRYQLNLTYHFSGQHEFAIIFP